MALALNGTSNGSLNNLSLSGNTGTVIDTARVGGILQVVQGTTSTAVTVGTGTYTDTGLTASITPSSSSNKILVMVMQSFVSERSVTGQGFGLNLLRDTTTIWDSQGNYHTFASVTNLDGHAQINYLDSPATTSSVTYKTQGRPYSSADNGQVTFQYSSPTAGPSTITLMEVVA